MTGIYREEQVKLRHIANVWGVYVRPENRGQGAATRLIQACIAWAGERDLKVIKLAVVTTNSAAIRCYIRAGFRVYGVEAEGVATRRRVLRRTDDGAGAMTLRWRTFSWPPRGCQHRETCPAI